jgi:glycerol-3-phosphate dehydrogenase
VASGALDPAARERALAAATSGELDLLIVGGGITGAGAALDAATRGLRVALVEARDLAAGASSASSKLIHGGLRYLEMGDVGLVREALRERELLLTRLAPHLVAPVPFLWPLRGRGWERAYLGAGLALYDSLGGARSVPRHRHLSRRGARAVAPALRPDALVGAVRFHDAAEDDARMVVAVARTAAAHGAHVATRVRVTGFRPRGELEAVDEETGATLRLRARHVAAAAGAWTDRLRALAGGRSDHRIVPSKGVHVFVARERIQMDTGLLARTEKSVLFVIPWQGGWLIGDTDTPWRAGPDEVVASGADVDYLLAKANALLAAPLTRADVHGVTAGLRPLVADAASKDTTRISRRHVVESPLAGLTTIAGGKYTTYRVMAAALVDAAARALGSAAPSATRDVPLHGGGRVDRAALAARAGLERATVDALVGRHGDHARELVDLIAARPALAAPLEGGDGVLRAEVAYACTHEGALHLEDVLARRTRLAIVAPDRGLAAAAPAAALMGEALGWAPDRVRAEADAWRARVAAARAAEAEPDDARALAAHRAALAERQGGAHAPAAPAHGRAPAERGAPAR